MKRVLVCISILLVLLVFFTGLSSAEKSKPKVILKMATNAPDEVGWSVYLRDPVSTSLQRVTNNEVVFSWYWGGLMGGERDNIQKMSIDQVQGTAMSSPLACPSTGVLQLPFIFRSYDEVEHIMTIMRPEFSREFERYGFEFLQFFHGNFMQIFSTKREIRTPDDFSKSRFVSWNNDVEIAIMEAMGAKPIPIDVPEMSPSARAGVVDALLVPAMWYVGSQLYTITKAVVQTKIQYLPGCVIISKEAWSRIPEQYHKAIKKMMVELEPGFFEFTIDGDEKCYSAMIKYGMKEVKLKEEELELWKKMTRPVWDDLAGSQYSKELLNEVLFRLEEYRSKTSER